jgi:hypothetical protein
VDNELPRIKGQDSSYRRGLMLGLTMTEMMLLILFILLLLMGVTLATREEAIRKKDARISELADVESFLQEETRKGDGKVSVTNIIQHIRRQKQLENQIAAMKPQAEAGKALEDIIREIKRSGGQGTPKEIAEVIRQIAELQKEKKTLAGQVAQMTKQIQKTGKGGNEFPSCWVTPQGKTQSIYDLYLTTSGIRIRDRKLPDHVEDEVMLPISQVELNTNLTTAAFLEQLRPLYNWSVENKCRFYVILHSDTASAPVQAVNAANNYFYPDSRIQMTREKP